VDGFRHCEERSDEAIQYGISVWIASRHDVALAMTSRSRSATKHPRHCEERSDEAIQSGISVWIASRHDVALAMTSRSRSATKHPRHCEERSDEAIQSGTSDSGLLRATMWRSQ
jgi:head-tail adaptor